MIRMNGEGKMIKGWIMNKCSFPQRGCGDGCRLNDQYNGCFE